MYLCTLYSVYKSIYYLWLEFGKCRSLSILSRQFFTLSLAYFSRKVSLPSEETRRRFPSVVVLIPVPVNAFLVSSSSASDFNIIQKIFSLLMRMGENCEHNLRLQVVESKHAIDQMFCLRPVESQLQFHRLHEWFS